MVAGGGLHCRGHTGSVMLRPSAVRSASSPSPEHSEQTGQLAMLGQGQARGCQAAQQGGNLVPRCQPSASLCSGTQGCCWVPAGA